MKTTKLSPHRALILIVAVLALALPACSEIIVNETTVTEPSQVPSPTAGVAAATMPPTAGVSGAVKASLGDILVVRSYPSDLETYVVPQSDLTGSEIDVVYLTSKDYFVGRTPLEVKLEPGEYRVTVKNFDDPIDFRWDGEADDIFFLNEEGTALIPGAKSYAITKRAGHQAIVTALFWPKEKSLQEFVETLPDEELFEIPDMQLLNQTFQEHGVPTEDWTYLVSMLRRSGKAIWYDEDGSDRVLVHYVELEPARLVMEPLATALPVTGTSTPTTAQLVTMTPMTPTSTSTPTAAVPVVSATAPPPPRANWQRIPDLPRSINALVVDPTNPQVLYAGTGSSGAGSGVYKSEDAGLSWQLVSEGLPSEDVVALAFSRDDPPILYAAVGNNVFASADGGAGWSQRAQGVGNYRGFEQLYVAPGDGQALYGVAVIEGVFRSDDGGNNWLAVNEGLPRDSNGSLNVQSLAVDPADANVVYLGTGWRPFHGNGVYKSTDGGATWASANRGMTDYSITALAIDPSNPEMVYAVAFDGSLFKSDDGGATWNNLTDKLPDQERSRSSIWDIAIDPDTPETIYLLDERMGVLVSYDGGERWRILGKPGELEYPSFTAMTIIFGPQPLLVVGIRDEGGWRYDVDQLVQEPTPTPSPADSAPVVPTPPPGSWQPVPELPRQINALAVNPADPQVLYAGTGSSGAGGGVYKSEDAGLSWQLASQGLPSEDVRALAFSRTAPPTLYAAVGHRDVFASNDGAQNWTRVGNYELTGFKARLAVAPSDGNVLFIIEDVRGAYRSLDGGHTWLPVGEGLPQDEDGNASVQSLAIDPTNANIVYLGTGWGSFNGNGIYKSTDGGETWARANRGMIDYGITALAVNPVDPQVVYAGAESGELFKSTDGGVTWSNLAANLPDQTSVLEIAIDPAMTETVYLLCERVGVLVSYDGGARWRILGKPGELDYPSFTTMAVIFGPRPVLIVGVRDEGGWRYAAD